MATQKEHFIFITKYLKSINKIGISVRFCFCNRKKKHSSRFCFGNTDMLKPKRYFWIVQIFGRVFILLSDNKKKRKKYFLPSYNINTYL
jgi:hypothetical protein